MSIPCITTDRLLLRGFSAHDFEAHATIMADPQSGSGASSPRGGRDSNSATCSALRRRDPEAQPLLALLPYQDPRPDLLR